ncbi:GIY-YIG nuclease family protein [Rhodococcus sp. NPDC057014]|uniref:GIY-YIG nuclease family protein n=1 Tax=Rhodococcus sp. NPDC057014 TaxID=3346000 RepID=UPI003642D554
MISDELKSLFDADDDGLLDTPEKPTRASAADRLERSFVEIADFYREHGRAPSPDTRDIAERKLGARLDGMRADEDKTAKLTHLDEFGLLADPEAPASLEELLEGDDTDLLNDATGLLDTSDLPTRVQRNEPDEIAQRVKSNDFDSFAPLFVQKHAELADGTSTLMTFRGLSQIVEGAFFVLSGIMVFVAGVGAAETSASGRTKQRLRCIFENGTESSMYRQSLSTRLYEEEGYAVVQTKFDSILADDRATGYVYVLRSLSDDPQISSVADLYKIGFSRGTVEKRIAGAEHEPTYLMAPVEIVASYRTYNLKTSALEHLLHRVFSEVRLSVNQVGKDGRVYEPSEWYVVPLPIIDRAIEFIRSGDIVHYEYDADLRTLKPRY